MRSTTLLLTGLTLIAFAGNSVLTRLALAEGHIDAGTFTTLRLGSGAVALTLWLRLQNGTWPRLRGGQLRGPLALLGYAVPFSWAYLRLGTATGALVLFGMVQVSLIGYAITQGTRPSLITWVGIGVALLGFAQLTLPAASRPDLAGLGLMATAGIAWAVYTWLGKSSRAPLTMNAFSFFWAAVLSAALSLTQPYPTFADARGVTLSVVAGALTSGIGYALWYRVLPRLSVTQAAVSQLSVPVLAGLGGALLLAEVPSWQLVTSGGIVLAGIALVFAGRAR